MKIFIVDDEIEMIDYYVDALEMDDHVIVGTAANGEEAVKKYPELAERPDIVLMDHRMPIKNGMEATREILQMDSDAKVIIASADHSVKNEAIRIGAIEFKQKPFSLDELLINIKKFEVQGSNQLIVDS